MPWWPWQHPPSSSSNLLAGTLSKSSFSSSSSRWGVGVCEVCGVCGVCGVLKEF